MDYLIKGKEFLVSDEARGRIYCGKYNRSLDSRRIWFSCFVFGVVSAISQAAAGEAESGLLKPIYQRVGLGHPERFDASDPRAEGGLRAKHCLVRIPGGSTQRLWIVTHMDVVPEGDGSL